MTVLTRRPRTGRGGSRTAPTLPTPGSKSNGGTPALFDFEDSDAGYPFWGDPKSAAPQDFRFEAPERQVEVLTPYDIPLSRKFESSVVMYMGRRGRGKTLGMTVMAHFQHEAYRRPGCVPKAIAANYWMQWAKIVKPGPLMLDWLNSFDPDVRNLYACMDEIASQVANRKSLRTGNVDFNQVLVQIRKREIEMAFATQFPQTVDYQTLLQTDLFMEMDGYDFDYRGIPGVIHVKVADWWGQWTGRNWRKRWPPSEEDWDDNFEIHLVDRWGLANSYRSNQVIPPPWVKNSKQLIYDEFGDLVDYTSGQELDPVAIEIAQTNPKDIPKRTMHVQGDSGFPLPFKALWLRYRNMPEWGKDPAKFKDALLSGEFGEGFSIYNGEDGQEWVNRE